jgi:sugar fermentation stimulation protein A
MTSDGLRMKDKIFLSFPRPQQKATFLRRTQRFLAEMELPSGTKELVYCPNPGAMIGFLKSGSEALLSESSDRKRKRRYTWQAVRVEGQWIGTNTGLSNQIVEKALSHKLIPSLEKYHKIIREHSVEDGFRVDFKLSGDKEDCLLEVKSATVVEKGVARYPDSLTPRGVKQLKALERFAQTGSRAIILFLIQRSDAVSFAVNKSHDLAFAEAFDNAISAGVELIALEVPVCPEGFGTPNLLPCTNTLIKAENTAQDTCV